MADEADEDLGSCILGFDIYAPLLDRELEGGCCHQSRNDEFPLIRCGSQNELTMWSSETQGNREKPVTENFEPTPPRGRIPQAGVQ